MLLEIKGGDMYTLLQRAVAEGDERKVRGLLAERVDVNELSEFTRWFGDRGIKLSNCI